MPVYLNLHWPELWGNPVCVVVEKGFGTGRANDQIAADTGFPQVENILKISGIRIKILKFLKASGNWVSM